MNSDRGVFTLKTNSPSLFHQPGEHGRELKRDYGNSVGNSHHHCAPVDTAVLEVDGS